MCFHLWNTALQNSKINVQILSFLPVSMLLAFPSFKVKVLSTHKVYSNYKDLSASNEQKNQHNESYTEFLAARHSYRRLLTVLDIKMSLLN